MKEDEIIAIANQAFEWGEMFYKAGLFQKAKFFLKSARKLGIVKANLLLGEMFEEGIEGAEAGESIEKNLAEAHVCFMALVEGGYPIGKEKLENFYINNSGFKALEIAKHHEYRMREKES